MLLSGKSLIIDLQACSSNNLMGNQIHIEHSKNRRVFFRFTVKFMLATMAFVGMGFAGIVTLDKMSASGVAIADGNRSGCEHRDGCLPSPETY